MELASIFGYVPKDQFPSSKHEFHFQCSNQPTNIDWDNWFYSRIFSPILVEHHIDATLILKDYSDEKPEQIISFLNFHFDRFKGDPKNFLFVLQSFMTLSQHHNASQYKLYYKPCKDIVAEWIALKDVLLKSNQTISQSTRNRIGLKNNLNSTNIYLIGINIFS